MLKLHGRPRSNYYNAVKTVLIERDIAFEEVVEPAPPTPEYLELSPMAKVPCLVTDSGPITETTTIIAYLEDAYPENSLAASDPYTRAKEHEIAKAFELYIEWVARRGYPVLRGDGDVTEADKAAIRAGLEQATDALPKLTRFDPWVMGDRFSWVDLYVFFMLIYAVHSARVNVEMDLLAGLPGAQDWFERMQSRSSVARAQAEAAEYAKSLQT